MRGKGKIAALLVFLFLLPAYTYAASGISGRSSHVESRKYVPITVYYKKIGPNNTAPSYGNVSNQISEMAVVTDKDKGYRVSLQIGTYSALDVVQIVRPEKSEEVLEQGATKIPFGSFNTSEVLEELCDNAGIEVNEDANQYYLSEKEVEVSSYRDALDTALVSFDVPDLETPIIVKTFSKKNQSDYGCEIIKLNGNKMFEAAELTKKTPEAYWSGWMTGDDATMTEELFFRSSLPIDENHFFARAFDADNVQIRNEENSKYTVSIPVNSLTDEDEIVSIETAIKRPAESQDGSSMEDDCDDGFGNNTAELYDYWAIYQEAEIENGNLILSYDSIEDMAMGRIFRVTTVGDQEANEEELDEAYQVHHYASLYLKPKSNEKKSVTDDDTGISFTYWSDDYDNGSTFSAKNENRYLLLFTGTQNHL